MIALNAMSQMVALGSILLIQTAYMILAARFLGPEDFGRFSFTWSIIQIFLLGGDLGLHNTALRKISAVRERSQEVTRTFFQLKILLSAVLFVLVLLIAWMIRETPATRLALVFFGVGMFFHCLSLGINVVFQSHGRLYLASLNTFVIFFSQALIGTLCLFSGGGIVSLSLAYLVAAVGGTAVNWRIFTRQIHPLRFRCPENWKEFAKESAPVGLSNFFQTLSSRIALTLITFLASPFHTGIYSAAVRIPQALNNIPVGIFGAVLPAMAAHQERTEPVLRLFRRSLWLMLGLSSVVAIAIFWLSGPLILLIYGDQYQQSVGNLQIQIWSVIPVFVGMAFSHVLLSQSRLVRRLPWITGSALVVNLVGSFVLIPMYRSLGASIVLVGTECFLAAGYAWGAWTFLRSRDDR